VITNFRFDLGSFRPALNPRLLEGRTLAARAYFGVRDFG
jgi:hypothetical protein